MNHWIALKSAWKAGLRQFRKRLTELRRGPVPGNVTVNAPTSGVPLIIGSGQEARVVVPDDGVWHKKGPQDLAI